MLTTSELSRASTANSRQPISPQRTEKDYFVCLLRDKFVILRRFRVRWGKTREADRHPPCGEIRYLTKHQCTQS